MKKYLTKEAVLEKGRNILICIIGNIIIGLGVAVTKVAAFGNDPFCGSCMAVSDYFSVPYTTFTLCYNTFLFVFEVIFGRKHIGAGTFINWFLLCLSVDFFNGILGGVFTADYGLLLRLVFLTVGLLITGFGLTVYQDCDAGVAPYDALPMMICEHFPKLKYFAVRITIDSLSVLMILLFGGIAGLGTLLTALGLGPMVHMYRKLFRRLFAEKSEKPGLEG